MTSKQVITGAIVGYIFVLGFGGVAYFFLPEIKEAIPALAMTPQPNEITADEPRVAEDEAEREQAERAKAEAEAAEKRRQEAEAKRAKEQELAAAREARVETLTSGMKESLRGGVTLYTFSDGSKMSSGVHLRPFVMRGYEDVVLKNEICYYYSIYDDIPTNWVHGDALSVQADGQTFWFQLDPDKRRDHLASDAESLTERFVSTADDNALAMLRAVAKAGNVTLYYYKTGGVGCTTVMSREELRRIRDMVELYDLLSVEIME
ncbi:MAG: hypothetical protein IJ849_11685 [Selenomonadaceae bacterium]|nr:hypothetical protein [Selenomonadaceae bacterium]